jgi:hydroxyethylthiazole kinase-like uncharacterized protein yjeF
VDQLPDWLTPLLDAETMRGVDRWAIEEQGIPSLDLMERAGAGVTRIVERLSPDGPAVVVCGKGNNGGDGLVVARLLREAGRSVTVLCAAPPDDFAGDARMNLERLPGDPPLVLTEDRARAEQVFTEASVIVDALLGTGFQGEPYGTVGDAIEAVNAARAPVVSVDMPSGVDASTGVASGAAVRAMVTATFHAGKPGLWIAPGKTHAGEVHTIDIGIPRGSPRESEIGLIGPAVFDLLPKRAASSTKFISGYVLIAGGSRGLTGAPRMAAHAAMRAGAGYVTGFVPESVQPILATAGPPELMTKGLPDDGEGGLTAAGVDDVLEASERGGALALGPGLGRSGDAVAFARELARRAEVALVLDADGLNAHAGRLGELSARSAPTVLTPHAGELGRLLEVGSEEIERERLRHARAAAEQARAVVVLKGDDTLIAAGLDPFDAASAGVSLHAQAGRDAARGQGAAEGVVASDVIAALPAARGGPTHERRDADGEGR